MAASRMVSDLESSLVVEIPTLDEVEAEIDAGKNDPNSRYYCIRRTFDEKVVIEKDSRKYFVHSKF
jgi:hypothetical protein